MCSMYGAMRLLPVLAWGLRGWTVQAQPTCRHACALVMAVVAMVALLPGCSKRHESAAQPSGQPRLISLSPSATETVAAVGAVGWLVGVDQYSTYPAEVTKLPKVGAYLTPNLEVILQLRPTLVLVDDVHRATAEALQDAGITTLRCEIQTLADVQTAVRDVGASLGKTDAAAQVLLQIAQAKTAARGAANATRPVVLAIIDRQTGSLGGLVAAGPGSWLDELLTVVGATNALATSPVRYPKISLEEVLRAQPEVILDLSDASSHDDAPQLWQTVHVPATKAGRVRVLMDSYLRAPSPRVAAAIQALREALQQ